MEKKFFTSESVSEGHPDKLCDQISDAVLDEIIGPDKNARVACECYTTTGIVIVGGQITTNTYVDAAQIARGVMKKVGYNNADFGIDYKSCSVLAAIEPQSADISQGVTEGEGLFKEQGAGDQGMMFGYATTETAEYMPAPIMWSHQLLLKAAELRKNGKLPFLRPDSKSQVTVEYNDGKPGRVDTVVISHQHDEDVTHDRLKEAMIESVIKPTLPEGMLDSDTKYYINPTGRFVIGGPHGDTGLTGRKIIVDTYGGMGRHGGGAFSGKDPSKVDRSAAYMCRYIAKNIVAAGLCEKCEIEVAYAIGVAKPMSVFVDTFGTGKVPEAEIERVIDRVFDLTPKGIITTLDLLNPVYQATAAYGHFGRDEFSWEKTDKIEQIKSEIK